MDEQILQRLATLESQAEIQGLFARYARSIDAGTVDDLRDIFTTDVLTRHSLFEPATGDILPADRRERFIANVKRFIDANAKFQHYISAVESKIDGDEGSAVASLLLVRQVAGRMEGEILLEGGRYVAKLRRTADGWRIYDFLVDALWLEPAVRALYGR